MSLILVAHGTRRPDGVAMIGDLAAQVGALVGGAVQVAFVDVLGPTPCEVLSSCAALPRTAQPAIVVPAFLSRGYHVRTDLPAHVAASGHPHVTVTPALGPSREIARILADQLAKSRWRPGDSVILAAAGTSDRRARADLRTAAALLSSLTGSRVDVGFAATGDPDIRTAVTNARHRGARRVAVASYLLAEGLFQERLKASDGDLVTQPLGTHPALAQLIADRFRSAAPNRSGSRRMRRLPNCAEHTALPTSHADANGA
ncbi:sirohydrochlorin chelatase [Mycobacterium intracellulare]|uniref:sirohydrochlorin chelatase n=1 Tax=Mycobacterium intracellulare TaxID=1767 RepID=UPI0006CA7099|nr:sirohydrochlorin chelatase [Mycobacterium intracellulare]KPN48125.1 cobalamin biosynthesis protein CbiX [Mycobacterium intracellulare subsp. chimaera]